VVSSLQKWLKKSNDINFAPTRFYFKCIISDPKVFVCSEKMKSCNASTKPDDKKQPDNTKPDDKKQLEVTKPDDKKQPKPNGGPWTVDKRQKSIHRSTT